MCRCVERGWCVMMSVRESVFGMQLPGRECGASGDFPGYCNIHVGVQRKNRRAQLLDLHPGDAATAVWTFGCAVDGTDVRGPHIQGPPGGRFISLSWGTVDDAGRFNLFRRAKLMRGAARPARGCHRNAGRVVESRLR